jgi:ribosomal protein S18 acetylase RimI-like enzyme
VKNSIINKIKYEYDGLLFLIRNTQAARPLSPMQEIGFSNYKFIGLPGDRINELDELHQLVREGRRLNFWRKTFYKYQGSKVCGVVINDRDLLVGFNYYYFRENELKDKIIHEAFLGISPNERGKGIATALQRYTLNQLSKQPLTGVSGNVEKANLPSIKMLQRVGYDFIDDPQDPLNYQVFYGLKTTAD